MKCPYCESEMSTSEYISHLEKCPEAKKHHPTFKQLFKGEVLDGYIEAAKVKPLTELKEYPVEEWYILYAPHTTPPYYQFEYKIMGSWNLLRFEKFEDLMKLLSKGREEMYVHATRGKEMVTWKPVMIQSFTLTSGLKEETPAQTFTLEQPHLVSTDPYSWIWSISVWDKTQNLGSRTEMSEQDWGKMWKKVPWQSWISTAVAFITEKTKVEGWASHEQVHKEMEARGMTHEEVDKVVAQLEREGTIYTPRAGYYRKT